MIKKILFTVFLFSLFSLFYIKTSTAVSMGSNNYMLCPIATSGGGTSESPNYKLFSVIGQPAIGDSNADSYHLDLGLYDECNSAVLLLSPYFKDFSYAGDLNYFNIFWDADYSILDFNPGPDREVAIECYLNNIQQCIPFPFVQDPGIGTCAVVNPGYEYGDSPDGNAINNASCKIYDPTDPSLLRWNNETFSPIAFDVTVSPTITTTVGEPFSLPINVKNSGLLTDDYTVEIIPDTPNLLSIELNFSRINNVDRDEIRSTYARIRLLATSQTSIRVNVTSTISCQYAPQGCISRLITVTIRGGMYSLPEFEFLGIIQIITIAMLVFAVIAFKKTYL